MIKAVIFDCFGVLATEGWIEFKASHFKSDFERSLASDWLHQHDRGFITAEKFAEEVEKSTGVSKDELLKVITSHQTKNTVLISYIPDLKSRGLKIGILSNTGEDWLNGFMTMAERELFDNVLLSYKVNLTKPDPLLYQMSADNLRVLTRECVFIDDRQACIDGAVEAGMFGIRYTDFPTVKAQLEALLKEQNPDVQKV